MQENEAIDFYDRIVNGKDQTNEITLEHSTGHTLDNVKMRPVSKRVLASVIQRLPDAMFEAVEESENPEEAEEELEERGMNTSAMTEQTVAAFEDLCSESLQHDQLTSNQMRHIVESLDFETLFTLGAEIIEISFDSSGDIKDFHEQE